MKALISDNFQDKDLNQFDIIFTYLPSSKSHKNVHYLFNSYQKCEVKEIIKFRKIFMETYLLKMIFQTDISKRHLTLISLKIFIENTVH